VQGEPVNHKKLFYVFFAQGKTIRRQVLRISPYTMDTEWFLKARDFPEMSQYSFHKMLVRQYILGMITKISLVKNEGRVVHDITDKRVVDEDKKILAFIIEIRICPAGDKALILTQEFHLLFNFLREPDIVMVLNRDILSRSTLDKIVQPLVRSHGAIAVIQPNTRVVKGVDHIHGVILGRVVKNQQFYVPIRLFQATPYCLINKSVSVMGNNDDTYTLLYPFDITHAPSRIPHSG
jgi:hypothetical protein